jgi:hypothetical protein
MRLKNRAATTLFALPFEHTNTTDSAVLAAGGVRGSRAACG